jgi:hypothetical protein
MNTIRMVIVTFINKIEPWEIGHFRGGIIAKVGIEHDWFHNHNNNINNQPKFHYRYPLIQYRYFQGHPQLICIEQGVEEVQQLFAKPDWEIRIGKRIEKLGIKDLQVKSIDVAITEKPYNYQLQHWLPFNPKNYEYYQSLEYEVDRLQCLEKILIGHILAFADGINWQITEQLQVRIKRIVKHKFVSYKDAKMMAFNLDFTVNARLPFEAALGQGVSLGFGLLHVPAKKK